MIIRRIFHIVVLVTALTASGSLGALELDREEIEDVSDVDIEFENYEGPVDTIDSRDAIREIGRVMGRGIAGSDRADYDSRYVLRRIIGDTEDVRLAADLIELSESSRVDHIENLRRILSGYLETAWGYDQGDADLLARFVTIYNAVNRGAMEIFSRRYREAVVNELDPQRAGLATSYRRWAGQTQIVIPIREDRVPGALDAVDPRQLVDSRVIDELRNRRDLGIEDRKAIIDFIERVIEERTVAIQEERAALDQEEQAIEERRAELNDQERAPDEADLADADTVDPDPADGDGQEQADRNPQEEEAVQDDVAQEDQQQEPAEEPAEEASAEQAADAEAASDEDAEELRELDQRQEEIVERQEELDQEQQEVEELTERVEELYEETAEDQATLDDQQEPTNLVTFVMGDGTGRFELAVVDFDDATVVGEQTIPVENRDLTEFQGSVVVAHQVSGRLLLLDPLSLSIMAESDSRVVPGSRITVVDGHLMTVMPEADSFFVGEFDAQLVLQRRSALPVLEDTDIVVRDDEVLVQGEDTELRVLRLNGIAQ